LSFAIVFAKNKGISKFIGKEWRRLRKE